MESKEEISKILVFNKYRLPVTPDDKAVYVVDIPKCSEILYKSMKIYAQQMAIEFAKWMILMQRATLDEIENKWKVAGSGVLKTNAELFDQFLNEKQK